MNLPLFSGRNEFSGFARSTRLFVRKRQSPLALQSLQKIPALPSLESAAGALPLQQFAYRVGQLQPADPGAGLDNLLDQRHLLCGKFPTTEPLLICCCLHAIILSLLSRNRTMASCPAKNGRGCKYLSRLPPIHSGFQTGKIADLAL